MSRRTFDTFKRASSNKQRETGLKKMERIKRFSFKLDRFYFERHLTSEEESLFDWSVAGRPLRFAEFLERTKE